MSDHALEVLEFHRVLDLIAGGASSAAAAERIRALRPSPDREGVARELARVGAVMAFVDEKPDWGLPPIPHVREALHHLSAQGALLEPAQLHGLGVLLRSSRLLAAELRAREARFPELAGIEDLLYEDPETEALLERSVDGEGQVLDTASRDLKQIRGRLRGAHNRVVRRLEAYMSTLPERFVVPDASVSIRDGRYVIPIRREGRSEVGGIVHDESATGATLFVEPPLGIELMNELRDLEREEAREIRRILGDLTERLAPVRDALAGALEALVTFDALHARARAALRWGASVPEVLEPGTGEFRISGGRHPLLVEGEDPVVPFDLEVVEGERAWVVSGPNTGGKSVLLKAVGLVAALAQSGVVPPVDRGTRLPVFRSIFADIGDEQSIARSLSTFSAHLTNLSEIVREADAHSLVLIDEMGSGTDPAEGAALARAVLEELVAAGAFAMVTSHMGELKRLDGEGTGIVNASLQFDPDRMEPTYRLVKGRPGRSYGLAIARRLGFPGHVLDRAEAYLDRGASEVEDLLERLERQERAARELMDVLEAEKVRTEKLARELETRERTLRDAERTARERAGAEARKTLLEARAEVESAIRELREAVEEGRALEDAAHQARRRVEEAARRQARSGKRRPGSRSSAPGLAVGDRVRVHATGARGRITELRSDRAVVETGGVRITLPAVDLEVVTGGESGPRRTAGRAAWPGEGQARMEVDLRGLRVDEVDLALQRALDQAVLDDLSELRIIHGKGTGALRKRVGELLSADARVRRHRMGGPTEGGAGVTVAVLSEG